MMASFYVNPSSVYAISIIFPVLCIVAVCVRFLSRRRTKAGYGADDWTSVGALFFMCWCAIILLYGVAERTIGWQNLPPGEGGMSFTKTTRTARLNSKLRFAFWPVSVITIGLIRLTICLLYRRVFRGRVFEIANWTAIGIILSWVIAFIFASLFQCGTHFSAFWGPQKQYAEQCPGSFHIYAGMALTDVIIDIMILILPIKPVIDLQMPSHRKVLLLLVFALGIFSIAAAMTRMVMLMRLLTFSFPMDGELFGLGTSEPLGITGTLPGTILWWTFMEIGVGCLVSNMPAMVGFFRGRSNPFKPLASRISSMSLRKNSGDSGLERGLTKEVEMSRSESQAESQAPSRSERSMEEIDFPYTDPRWQTGRFEDGVYSETERAENIWRASGQPEGYSYWRSN